MILRRTKRHTVEKVCKHCGKRFNAFRRTAKFCDDSHRVAFARSQAKDRRQKLIREFDGKCALCGASGRLFIRRDPETGQKRPLCGHHNGEQSRQMFRKREPEAGPGYVKRLRQRLQYKRPKRSRLGERQRREARN